ncbi:uncharacterized protein BYT42DRAFT_319536 [Radiomyces spectabilis]|uniref:uncharacterized protein n=1 Tax=Radiomyces spectabilis TaxID=64574 RepID=UPI0022202FE3|nr:uncharacterized protein BYT42DRAFT_319536 [Radiomyces spectabilis]KAI8379229.1 hypothetical protein BYT42DRAFT_319536 [Radiomyces spectabilis]
MSDLNWCTYCDNAISSFSNSLYCSEQCLKADALNHHPLLGYDYAEFKNFPRSSPIVSSTTSSSCSSSQSSSPPLSPIPNYSFSLSSTSSSSSPSLLELEAAWSMNKLRKSSITSSSTLLASPVDRSSIFF